MAVLKKYMRWHCQSFTDDNQYVKWCPFSKECNYVVEKVDTYSINDVVDCVCGNSFCFKCSEELHRPATCHMFKEWDLKNQSESENTTWIIANTKPC